MTEERKKQCLYINGWNSYICEDMVRRRWLEDNGHTDDADYAPLKARYDKLCTSCAEPDCGKRRDLASAADSLKREELIVQ